MKKIAVPSRGNMVDEHFGHCEAFTVYHIDEKNTIATRETLCRRRGVDVTPT
jgi:predicted Fe-Mo cluster-binding NifX family protein